MSRLCERLSSYFNEKHNHQGSGVFGIIIQQASMFEVVTEVVLLLRETWSGMSAYPWSCYAQNTCLFYPSWLARVLKSTCVVLAASWATATDATENDVKRWDVVRGGCA